MDTYVSKYRKSRFHLQMLESGTNSTSFAVLARIGSKTREIPLLDGRHACCPIMWLRTYPMHELSIAQSIIDIIHQHVPAPDLAKVRSINVLVGAASGVVAESLAFSYTAIVAGTPLASSTMEVEHVPYHISCRACGVESDQDDGLRICPMCGSSDTIIVSGTELRVKDIELAETT